jgi:hypothetical protein
LSPTGCMPDLNPLNAELNPICHLLALLEGATIVVVSRLRVNIQVHEGKGKVITYLIENFSYRYIALD